MTQHVTGHLRNMKCNSPPKQIVLRNVRNIDKLIDRKLKIESPRKLDRNLIFIFLESVILVEIKMETNGQR